MLTGHASIELAVRAIKLGAETVPDQPVDLEALNLVLERLIGSRRDRRKRLAGEHRAERDSADPFIGSSRAIARLREEAHRVLEADRPILIEGETGAGKSVLARWLPKTVLAAARSSSTSTARAFPASSWRASCSATSRAPLRARYVARPGFSRWRPGTLFLDELGDMDITIQPRLLRVLEERSFRRLGDVRDIQSTCS